MLAFELSPRDRHLPGPPDQPCLSRSRSEPLLALRLRSHRPQEYADAWALDRECLKPVPFLPTSADEIVETRALAATGEGEFDDTVDTCTPVVEQWTKWVTDYTVSRVPGGESRTTSLGVPLLTPFVSRCRLTPHHMRPKSACRSCHGVHRPAVHDHNAMEGQLSEPEPRFLDGQEPWARRNAGAAHLAPHQEGRLRVRPGRVLLDRRLRVSALEQGAPHTRRMLGKLDPPARRGADHYDTTLLRFCRFDRFWTRDVLASPDPDRTIIQNFWPPVGGVPKAVTPPGPDVAAPPPDKKGEQGLWRPR